MDVVIVVVLFNSLSVFATTVMTTYCVTEEMKEYMDKMIEQRMKLIAPSDS
nr:hypothetical protein TetV2_00204 [Oceanusvirus sp.]